MKFNTAVPFEATRAREYFDQLIEKKARVEITKVSARRSLNQNAYLHLLISAFGAHFGYTNIEAKHLYKEMSQDIYTYTKKGRTFYCSSADLTTEDMSRSIERFRTVSAEAGYPLPSAIDQEWIDNLGNSIEQMKSYL